MAREKGERLTLEYLVATCTGRVPFETRGVAEKVAGRHRGHKGWRRPKEVYFCVACRAFHLGRKPRKRSGRPVDAKRDRYGEVRL